MIARSGGGINESFTVRKISYGEGVERVFPIYSPYIAEIEVLRRGKVRRAKLYYLRGRRGKAARIFERTDVRARRLNAQWKGFKKPKGEADDLTRIKGIDVDLPARLKHLNCYKFEQVANLSDKDIANVDETLKLDGRIERDNWVVRPRTGCGGRCRRGSGRGLSWADPGRVGPSDECKRRRRAVLPFCFVAPIVEPPVRCGVNRQRRKSSKRESLVSLKHPAEARCARANCTTVRQRSRSLGLLVPVSSIVGRSRLRQYRRHIRREGPLEIHVQHRAEHASRRRRRSIKLHGADAFAGMRKAGQLAARRPSTCSCRT